MNGETISERKFIFFLFILFQVQSPLLNKSVFIHSEVAGKNWEIQTVYMQINERILYNKGVRDFNIYMQRALGFWILLFKLRFNVITLCAYDCYHLLLPFVNLSRVWRRIRYYIFNSCQVHSYILLLSESLSVLSYCVYENNNNSLCRRYASNSLA